MPIFIAALIGGLASVCASLVGRILTALAISYVTYEGFSFLLDGTKSLIVGYVTGLPATILTIAGLLQLDTTISILFSAYAARLVVAGVTSGAVTKVKIK